MTPASLIKNYVLLKDKRTGPKEPRRRIFAVDGVRGGAREDVIPNITLVKIIIS